MSVNSSAEMFNKAIEAQTKGDMSLAYQLYVAAVMLRPPAAGAWNNLGVMLKENKKHLQGKLALEAAVAIEPCAHYYSNLGDVLWDLGEYDYAESCLRKALELEDTCAPAWYDLGLSLMATNRFEEAMKCYDRALELAPDRHDFKFGRAVCLLTMGDYEQGFPAYDCRIEYKIDSLLKMPYPMWRGEDIAGKILYIFAEQGLGDSLQFIRFIPELVRRYPQAKITIDLPGALRRLFNKFFNKHKLKIKVRTMGDPLPAADYFMALTSIVARLGYDKSDISSLPYLEAPTEGPHVDRDKNLAVGIVWAGDPAHEKDKHRSSTLEAYLKHLYHPKIDLYSILVGPRSQDIQLDAAQALVRDMSPTIKDMGDTAYIAKQLDAIVTVDTSVAHLGGALGVETHVLLPIHGIDWRWFNEGGTSIWYDSVTLWRQSRVGCWDRPLAALGNYLKEKASCRP